MTSLESIVQLAVMSLEMGMTFALIAAGLTLIFGMLDVVNFAHGSFYMVGAYVGVSAMAAVSNFWVALIVVPIVIGLIGFVVETGLLRRLYDYENHYQILATFALVIMTHGAVVLVWGTQHRRVTPPEILTGMLTIGPVTYPTYRIFMLVVSTILVATIWLVLSRSDLGTIMRACKHDPVMVRSMGIDVPKLYTLVFAAGVAVAAIAGFLLGVDRGVHPQMDLDIIIVAFAVVVIGGLGDFRGAVVGALIVGVVSAVGPLFAPRLAELFIFLVMAAILIVRPNGLFGQEVRG